jgi:aminoglycoside phosphotransferase (APT) family kinase protein
VTPAPGAPEWTAEIAVSLDDARELIAAQFPELAAATIEPFAYGWDNTAYLVDGEYIFRFPRRSIAAPLIAREIEILPLIAPVLPAPIPVPQYVGRPQGAFPWRFYGYRRLAGTTMCSAAYDGAVVASQIGSFLRALHAVDPQQAMQRGLPGDEIGRLNHVRRFPVATNRLAELFEAQHIDDPAPLLDALERIAPQAGEGSMCIVHGDLYVRHVLVDERGALGGIIDWGDVHVGDAALDLMIADLAFEPEHQALLFEAYGPIDERTRLRARYRAIYHAALTAHYGLSIGDAELTAASLRALERLR